jgi:UDP-2,3-diacylglucosamine hydrolase
MKKTLFISDMHLDESLPHITDEFTRLLTACDSNIEALYILGDMFESWIGDDENTLFHQQITQAIHAASERGIKIYFTHGNRDFLVGKRFLRKTGLRLIPTEEKLTLYGTPVLLMHGDTLCTLDVAYLKARKIGFNPFYQFLFLLLPLKIRNHIRQKMRAKSAAYKKTASREIMDVTQTEVEAVMQKHAVRYLIHGHTHRPATHEFVLNGEPAYRIVLPAWHTHGSVFVWYEDGSKRMISVDQFISET